VPASSGVQLLRAWPESGVPIRDRAIGSQAQRRPRSQTAHRTGDHRAPRRVARRSGSKVRNSRTEFHRATCCEHRRVGETTLFAREKWGAAFDPVGAVSPRAAAGPLCRRGGRLSSAEVTSAAPLPQEVDTRVQKVPPDKRSRCPGTAPKPRLYGPSRRPLMIFPRPAPAMRDTPADASVACPASAMTWLA
jgi:hypothetical protein